MKGALKFIPGELQAKVKKREATGMDIYGLRRDKDAKDVVKEM